MNYISEINSFYNWLMLNPIQPDAQALWHVLMQMNNRCAVRVNDKWLWRVEFTVPNSTILSILAFSRQQLDRMRNVLIQAGRIVYKKGKGNISGTYKIIPFDTSLVDDYVDNFSEKVWITCLSKFVSHNVTQIDTQYDTQYDTQSGHKADTKRTQSGHKADTNGGLCNIFGTLINSNNINNNINNNNNSFCGDDDKLRAHTCDSSLSDFLKDINSYFGMTEEIKIQVMHFTQELFGKYFTRNPSQQDMVRVFKCVFKSKSTGHRQADLKLDADKKGLLDYAFRQASLSGNDNWGYIDGVLDRLHQRGLKNAEDCENYDICRGFDKNGI